MNAIPASTTLRRARARAAAGFTLIELLVVMGILTGFLLMLAQLVQNGLDMFGEGELGQALADRSSNAQRVVARELSTLRGSSTGRDREVVDDRLVVQLLPIGLPARPERGATRVQVLRGAVRLEPDRELALIDARLAEEVRRETPGLSELAVQQKVAERRVGAPLRGLGNLLLLPARQEGDDALLELRAAWFLPDQQLPIPPDRSVDPFSVPVPGGPDLPGIALYEATAPILRDLLHVEFLLWGQATQRWGATAQPTGGSSGGPLRSWDSARGGWLVDEAAGGVFALDRGAASAGDPRDDVHPHAILVRCVVAQPGEFAPEGVLAGACSADDTSLRLYDGDRFPGPLENGFVKIHGEWIGYAERVGDELRGLRRGARDTKVLDHGDGARVHVGRTVEFVVPIAHAKDDWNG
jgi:prepilin-type N-terminal cleavage/methylation domain-containing protein